MITKGKWKVEDGDFGLKIICQPSGPADTLDIAEINIYLDIQDEIESNARLIAAAPELLEACKQAMIDIDRTGYMKVPHIVKMQQAIAKATDR